MPTPQILILRLNVRISLDNKQFFDAVSQSKDIGELRLRLGIILKETGEFIGWCCSGIKEELRAPNREIMYAISKDHRGKGLTTQASQGMINYLFEHTNVAVLSAVALLYNVPSNRVLQKCGFNFQRIIEIVSKKVTICGFIVALLSTGVIALGYVSVYVIKKIRK